MLKNRTFQIFLAIVLITTAFLATISAVSASAPSKEDLTWPPRPDFWPLRERNVAPPSYRSPLDECFDVPIREAADCRNANQVISAIPITGVQDISDYHQRHSQLSMLAENAVDISDYFLRHPDVRVPATSIDLSDYFLRH